MGNGDDWPDIQAGWLQPGIRFTFASTMDADDCLEEPTIGHLLGCSTNCPGHHGLGKGFTHLCLAAAMHVGKDDQLVAAFQGRTCSLDNRSIEGITVRRHDRHHGTRESACSSAQARVLLGQGARCIHGLAVERCPTAPPPMRIGLRPRRA